MWDMITHTHVGLVYKYWHAQIHTHILWGISSPVNMLWESVRLLRFRFYLFCLVMWTVICEFKCLWIRDIDIYWSEREREREKERERERVMDSCLRVHASLGYSYWWCCRRDLTKMCDIINMSRAEMSAEWVIRESHLSNRSEHTLVNQSSTDISAQNVSLKLFWMLSAFPLLFRKITQIAKWKSENSVIKIALKQKKISTHKIFRNAVIC